jgi:hypothetical protein
MEEQTEDRRQESCDLKEQTGDWKRKHEISLKNKEVLRVVELYIFIPQLTRLN